MKSRTRIVAACVVLTAALLAVFPVRGYLRSRWIEAELARIREAGEPLTEDEFVAMFTVDFEGPDATAAWFEATNAIKPLLWAENSLPIVGDLAPRFQMPTPGEPWEEYEDVKEFLAKHSEALKLLHQAAEQEGTVRLPIDRASWNEVWDFVWDLRTAARFLALEATTRVYEGDHHGAASSILTIFHARRCLENVPWWPALAVRSTIDLAATSTVELLLPIADFTDEQLASFQAELSRVDYRESIFAGLLTARINGFNKLKQSRPIDFSGGDLRFRGDVSEYLQSMRTFLEASRMTWPEAMKHIKGISNDVADEGIGEMLGFADETSSHLENWPSVFVTYANRTAWIRSARVALAITRFRSRHGRLPTNLQQLVPEYFTELPPDPFNGEPLRYAPQEDGFVVYSVGKDEVDDGGRLDRSIVFGFDGGGSLWFPGFRIISTIMEPDVGFRFGAAPHADE